LLLCLIGNKRLYFIMRKLGIHRGCEGKAVIVSGL